MKKINFLIIATTIVAANLLVSCSSKKVGFFSNSYPQYVHKAPSEETVEAAMLQSPVPTVTEKSFVEKYGSEDEAAKEIVTNKPKTAKLVKSSKSDQTVSETVFSPIKKLTKEEKKQLKQIVKKETKTDDHTILLIILAIILPPLAVALFEGIGKGIKTPFWLDVLLTLLGWLPGVVYALWRILK